jgi:hypothetical protein
MRGVLFSLFAIAWLVLPSCNKVTAPSNPLDAPVITFFSADSLTVKTGTPVTLRWDVSGNNSDVRIDPHLGNVPPVGSASIILFSTTTFTLNARAAAGASAQRILTVIVTP